MIKIFFCWHCLHFLKLEKQETSLIFNCFWNLKAQRFSNRKPIRNGLELALVALLKFIIIKYVLNNLPFPNEMIHLVPPFILAKFNSLIKSLSMR